MQHTYGRVGLQTYTAARRALWPRLNVWFDAGSFKRAAAYFTWKEERTAIEREASDVDSLLLGLCPAYNCATGDPWRLPAEGLTTHPRHGLTPQEAQQRRTALIAKFSGTITKENAETYIDLAFRDLGYQWHQEQEEKWSRETQRRVNEHRDVLTETWLRVHGAIEQKKSFESYDHFVNWLRAARRSALNQRKRDIAKSEDVLTRARFVGTLPDWSEHAGTNNHRPNLPQPGRAKVRLNRDSFVCPWDGPRAMPEFRRARNPGYVPPEFRRLRKPYTPPPLSDHTGTTPTFGRRRCPTCNVSVPFGVDVVLTEASRVRIGRRYRELGSRESAVPLQTSTKDTTAFRQAQRPRAKKFSQDSAKRMQVGVENWCTNYALRLLERREGITDTAWARSSADPIEAAYWIDTDTEIAPPKPKSSSANRLNETSCFREAPSKRERDEATLRRVTRLQANNEAENNRAWAKVPPLSEWKHSQKMRRVEKHSELVRVKTLRPATREARIATAKAIRIRKHVLDGQKAILILLRRCLEYDAEEQGCAPRALLDQGWRLGRAKDGVKRVLPVNSPCYTSSQATSRNRG